MTEPDENNDMTADDEALQQQPSANPDAVPEDAHPDPLSTSLVGGVFNSASDDTGPSDAAP